MADNVVKIYADGACRGNQFDTNIGGYGVVLLYGTHKKELKGAYKNVTNNKMELLSIMKGLQELKRFDLPIEVYSDSQYVVNTINEGWNRNANQDFWRDLDTIISVFKDIKFIKVKGHVDNEYNNRADELANEAMDELEKKQ